MMILFTLYVNLVMSCLVCMMHAHMHGAHALCKNSVSKYLSGLACMKTNLKLAKITASYFAVLNTQKANENTPNKDPSFIPTCFGTKQKERKQ